MPTFKPGTHFLQEGENKTASSNPLAGKISLAQVDKLWYKRRMSLKPIAPKNRRAVRGVRPGMPVVVAPKKSSGGGGWIVLLLLVAALAGGYFVYTNQQKNDAALAAQKQRLEENAKKLAEAERQRAEYENRKKQDAAAPSTTALGTAQSADMTSQGGYADDDVGSDVSYEEDAEESGSESALGSTTIAKGTGEFAVTDTSAPPFDLAATGKAATKVMEALDNAIDQAGEGDSFHDLQADLKRSFEVANPQLFANESTLPAFPDKEQKLLRLAQGVYVCLNLAAELEARDTVPSEKHAKFVNWLMKDKAKAARIFTFGLEHEGINEVATAADLLEKLRQIYLKSPSSALKKIPAILKQADK